MLAVRSIYGCSKYRSMFVCLQYTLQIRWRKWPSESAGKHEWCFSMHRWLTLVPPHLQEIKIILTMTSTKPFFLSWWLVSPRHYCPHIFSHWQIDHTWKSHHHKVHKPKTGCHQHCQGIIPSGVYIQTDKSYIIETPMPATIFHHWQGPQMFMITSLLMAWDSAWSWCSVNHWPLLYTVTQALYYWVTRQVGTWINDFHWGSSCTYIYWVYHHVKKTTNRASDLSLDITTAALLSVQMWLQDLFLCQSYLMHFNCCSTS